MQLTQVVGNKVRLLRNRYGTTQDHVAQAARDVGLSWGRSSVAQLEAGTKALSAAELLLLPYVFLKAWDCEMTIAEILMPMDSDPEDDDWIELTDEARIDRSAADRLLHGGPPRQEYFVHTLDVPVLREFDRARRENYERLKGYRWLWNDATLIRLETAERVAGSEADRKLARALGVPVEYVSILAFKLWGRALVDERTRRLAEQERDGGTGAKGWVTRQLRDEVEQELARAIERRDA